MKADVVSVVVLKLREGGGGERWNDRYRCEGREDSREKGGFHRGSGVSSSVPIPISWYATSTLESCMHSISSSCSQGVSGSAGGGEQHSYQWSGDKRGSYSTLGASRIGW